MIIITFYDPALHAEPAGKDALQNVIQGLVNLTAKRNIILVSVRWKTCTGPPAEFVHHRLESFGLGERCENGDCLFTFEDFDRLVVTNIRFQHPKGHLVTWYCNDGRTAHQTNYILVRFC